MKKNKKERQEVKINKKILGVTLIALIITIIIMLILAGILINLALGKGGIIGKAQNAVELYKKVGEEEQIELNSLYQQLASYNKGGNINVSDMTSLVKQIVEEERLKQYPIGSIYISESEANPEEFIGGKWESYGEGRTLVGVGISDKEFIAGETGGESEHTLTIEEIPSHTHLYEVNCYNIPSANSGPFALSSPGGKRNVTYTGGSQSHNNLQPYITVYMWKRTS